MKLARIRVKNNKKSKKCNVFGGCNYTASCKEGEFFSASNLSSRRYPALSPRQIKYFTDNECSDFYIYNDSLYTISSGVLYKDYRAVLTLSSSSPEKRVFSVVGNYLCIMPDKQYYNISDKTSGSMEASFTGVCAFSDGTRFSVAAENNCISSPEADFSLHFKEGDGIRVTGSVNNDGYYVIREIDGSKLMFDENVFAKEINTSSVTISRDVPELEYSFECNNRLWGVYNNAVYASALGDPFNFHVFDGISTDSFYKEIYSQGNFTGGISYGGCPVFFKEDMVYRVFGDMPSGFYLEMREMPGVSCGCSMSLANVNGCLMYAGSDGIYSYDSSYPVKISRKLGDFRPGRACGGSDGERYYISVSDFKGVYSNLSEMLEALDDKKTFVYNTLTQTWHTIENEYVIERIESGNYGSSNDKPNVFALDLYGRLFTLNDTLSGSPSTVFFTGDYETVESEGITGVWEFDRPARLNRAVLSLSLPEGSILNLDVSYDGEEFISAGELTGEGKGDRKNYTLNMPLNRFSNCRLRFRSKGDFTLFSTELYYVNCYE